MTGAPPPAEIDHINGATGDNRWANLRSATSSLNSQNCRHARSDNRTGLLGAMPNKKGFMARITIGGAKHYLGTFPSAQQAHETYLKAKRQLHPGNTL